MHRRKTIFDNGWWRNFFQRDDCQIWIFICSPKPHWRQEMTSLWLCRLVLLSQRMHSWHIITTHEYRRIRKSGHEATYVCNQNRIITVTSQWTRWRIESPAPPLFTLILTQPFVQAQIKQNIQPPRHWPFWGEFIGDRWIPHTKGQ